MAYGFLKLESAESLAVHRGVLASSGDDRYVVLRCNFVLPDDAEPYDLPDDSPDEAEDAA